MLSSYEIEQIKIGKKRISVLLGKLSGGTSKLVNLLDHLVVDFCNVHDMANVIVLEQKPSLDNNIIREKSWKVSDIFTRPPDDRFIKIILRQLQ